MTHLKPSIKTQHKPPHQPQSHKKKKKPQKPQNTVTHTNTSESKQAAEGATSLLPPTCSETHIPTEMLCSSLEDLEDTLKTLNRGTAQDWKRAVAEILLPEPSMEARKHSPGAHHALGITESTRGHPIFTPITHMHPKTHYYALKTLHHTYTQARKITEAKFVDHETWGKIREDVVAWFEPTGSLAVQVSLRVHQYHAPTQGIAQERRGNHCGGQTLASRHNYQMNF
jgi:hypothetical protein